MFDVPYVSNYKCSCSICTLTSVLVLRIVYQKMALLCDSPTQAALCFFFFFLQPMARYSHHSYTLRNVCILLEEVRSLTGYCQCILTRSYLKTGFCISVSTQIDICFLSGTQNILCGKWKLFLFEKRFSLIWFPKIVCLLARQFRLVIPLSSPTSDYICGISLHKPVQRI